MNIRGNIAGVLAGLIVGLGGLTAAQAATSGDEPPNLRCDTVEECQQVIDVLYSDVKQLGQETNDLRRINARQARRIEQLKQRLQQQP